MHTGIIITLAALLYALVAIIGIIDGLCHVRTWWQRRRQRAHNYLLDPPPAAVWTDEPHARRTQASRRLHREINEILARIETRNREEEWQ